jgi:hypothetical protein
MVQLGRVFRRGAADVRIRTRAPQPAPAILPKLLYHLDFLPGRRRFILGVVEIGL